MVSLLAPWGVSAEDTTGGFTCLLWTFVTTFFGAVPASLLLADGVFVPAWFWTQQAGAAFQTLLPRALSGQW